MRKPSRFGWTPWVVLILALILVSNSISGSFLGRSLLGDRLPFFLFVALSTLVLKLLATPLTRRLVWRVRNRLVVTYFLIGVLPIALFLFMVLLSTGVLLAATISYITKAELNHQLNRIEQVAAERAKWSTVAGGIVVDGPIAEIPQWSKPGFKGVVRQGKAFFLAAHTESDRSATRLQVFTSEPFNDASMARLAAGFGIGLFFGIGSSTADEFTVDDTGDALLDSTRAAPETKPRGLWDLGSSGVVPLQVRVLETGETETYLISLFARPTTVIARLLNDLGPRLSGGVIVLLQTLGGVFVVVIAIAFASSLQLTRSLTRTIHDLHAGTRQVQSGDFSQRIPIRANDQLSDLAGSFNIMTHRIERLIGEVKEKEKLEAELEIARQVQAQLFPKGVPSLKTLELAGVCHPARTVSGDYYDFIPLESGLTALALGDISGKGISAALLMASLQSSLRAQLAMNIDGALSTSTLVRRLSRQLYDQTLPEKYATFYCGIYNDLNGQLLYTNAGHLPPILLRGKNSSRLEATGTVVGMFADSAFEQSEVQLQPGDLLVVFTDGITESEDKGGEQFGETQLTDLVIQHRDKPLDEIARIVTETVRTWAHDPDNQDDMTMLLARRF